MNLTITPKSLQGTLHAIPSKSAVHRHLICAALSSQDSTIQCSTISQDILATVNCLIAMGTKIHRIPDGFHVEPGQAPYQAIFPCGESGSTLRFLLPVAGALGIQGEFIMDGRLGRRPLFPLDRELEQHGVAFSRSAPGRITISGVLQPGSYFLPGNVSSQFISGLLFALPLLSTPSTLTILGPLESTPYINMTLSTLRHFGISIESTADQFFISPSSYDSPGFLESEGDWSNAAFWLGANALGSHISLEGLNPSSLQGDRRCLELFPHLGNGQEIDVSQVPDLFPVLAVVATAGSKPTSFTGGDRLRLKESDRIAAMAQLITDLGGHVTEQSHGLTVWPATLSGGTVSSLGDHRIAMAAAIAATICTNPVTILDAQSVCKSYPQFWEHYSALGGVWKEE